jgi:S-DNA-T family DNA segregation ATPase FtsK/SpoIIIE
MASYPARRREPLIDQTLQATLERRGRELLGVVLLAAALLLALALGSYAPDDPGWLAETSEPAQNMLGRAGAALAGTAIVIAGLGAWGVPLVLVAWGLRFVLHRGAERAMNRLLFALIAVALGSVWAATHAPGTGWPHAFGLGGLFGDTVLGALLGIVPLSTGFALKLLSVALLLATVAMGLFVTGFDRAELRAVARFLLVGAIMCYTAVALALAGVVRGGTVAARGAGTMAAAQVARARAARAAPAGEATGAEGHGGAPVLAARRRSAPPPAEPAFQPPRPLGAVQPRRLHPEPPLRPVAAAEPAAPRGLLSRVASLTRRAPDAEAPALLPELVEPPLRSTADPAMPTEDRIRARIADIVRARVRQTPALRPAVPDTPPATPGGLRRAEPPLVRPRKPAPLIYTPRPVPPVASPEVPLAEAPRAEVARAEVARAEVARPAGLAAPVAPPADLRDDVDLPDWNDWQPWDADEPDHPADLRAAAPPPYADPAPAAPGPLLARPGPASPSFAGPAVERGRPAILPAAAPQPERRMVQHPPRRPPAPSSRARSEAEPALRFEDEVRSYDPPPLSLLASPDSVQRHHLSDEALEENARMLENVLDDYGVKGEIVSVRPGPVVTMYELEPAPGLKASRVIGLADDIARSMSALSARVSTVPGRSVIGIELPNAHREKVVLREILAARDFGDSAMRLPLALGKDIGGTPVVANLAKMPHLLIAGTTGSGKSVAINTMILSLLYRLTPEECRLIMIDPKMLELSVYDGIPHLLSPVVTDPKKAVVALKWVVAEMEERYRKMSKMGVRNIDGYNGRVREALARGELFKRTIQTGFDEETGDPVFETDEFAPVALPYIVVIVDEMADLMMVAGKEIEACIQRLAQMARASGIHLIMATQRPSVDVITGVIKANFPTRISFQVTSKIDSRTILNEMGAEQLLGMGDMLYMAGGARITRIHGPFVSDEEVEEIVNHLKSFGPPDYQSGVVEGPDEDAASDIDMVLGLGGGAESEDALYDQAVAIVARDRKCSTSYIQRKLGIGYQKAARLVEQMEDQGVVTQANHVGKREILLPEA